MKILAIDPGSASSGFVLWQDDRVSEHGQLENELLLRRLIDRNFGPPYRVVIEQIEPMGMRVGATVFETAWWSGRFAQAAGECERVPRTTVKLHLCRSRRAKDPHIRQALIRRFGGPLAIGDRLAKGPLYGLASHSWSALAVAVTWAEMHRVRRLAV